MAKNPFPVSEPGMMTGIVVNCTGKISIPSPLRGLLLPAVM